MLFQTSISLSGKIIGTPFRAGNYLHNTCGEMPSIVCGTYERFNKMLKMHQGRDSLAVRWLGLSAFTAAGQSFIPHQGTKGLRSCKLSGAATKKKKKKKSPETEQQTHIQRNSVLKHYQDWGAHYLTSAAIWKVRLKLPCLSAHLCLSHAPFICQSSKLRAR